MEIELDPDKIKEIASQKNNENWRKIRDNLWLKAVSVSDGQL